MFKKRCLSLVLAFCMMFSLFVGLPVSVGATGADVGLTVKTSEALGYISGVAINPGPPKVIANVPSNTAVSALKDALNIPSGAFAKIVADQSAAATAMGSGSATFDAATEISENVAEGNVLVIMSEDQTAFDTYGISVGGTVGLTLDCTGSLTKGSKELSVKVINANLITNLQNVRVEIWDSDSNELSLSNPSMVMFPNDVNNGAKLVFEKSDGIILPFGKYTLKLFNNEQLVGKKVTTSDELFVVTGIVIEPNIITPTALNGADAAARTFSIDVSSDPKEYLWDVSTTGLSANVISDKNQASVITGVVTINADKTLSIELPQTNLDTGSQGWQSVFVYKDYGQATQQLLASGQLEIANIVINEIYCEEGKAEVVLYGSGLQTYYSSSTYVEVWNGVTKVATSNRVDFMWGNLHFSFDKLYITPGTNYTLKLFKGIEDKSSDLPPGGIFSVIPVLACSNPLITGSSEGESITMLESSVPACQWTAGATLTANIHGPGIVNYTAATGSGLAVNETDVVFTTTTGEGRAFPLQNGDYDIELFNGTTRLGRAYFIVDNPVNVLQGTVKDSLNADAGGGIVYIRKMNPNGNGWNWEERLLVGKDGKFYFRKDRMAGDGNYSIEVEPPQSSADVPGKTAVGITGGVLSPKVVTIHYEVPNISGSVKMPDGTTSAGQVQIEVFDSQKQYLFQTWSNSDGTYKLKVGGSGAYYLRARPGDSQQAVASLFGETIYDGVTPITNKVIQLETPQVTVTANNPSSEALTGDKFDIRVRPVDAGDGNYDYHRYQDSYLVGGMKPGNYEIYAVPSGDCTFAQSLPTKITIALDGTATPSTVSLQLTNPKLTGTVADISSNVVHEARVEVFQKVWDSYEYVTDVPLDSTGTFKVGGIPDGQYYIRAVLYQSSNLRDSDGSSRLTQITLGGATATQNLVLENKNPRIIQVENTFKGSSEIKSRIINVGSISAAQPNPNDSLKAEITDKDGASLSPACIITGYQNFYVDWGGKDNDNDETVLVVRMPNGLNLPVGKYKLKLTDMKDPANPGDDLVFESDITNGNCFDVICGTNFMPAAVKPDIAGQKLTENIDKTTLPWVQEDTLEVVLEPESGSPVSAQSYTIKADNSLEITLPSLQQGRYRICVSKNLVLLAQHWLDVGNPYVTCIRDISTDEDNITLEGNYLAGLNGETTVAKVYNQSSQLIMTSTKVDCYSGTLGFWFNGQKLPVGTYTLKVWTGEQINANLLSLPYSGQFKVVNGLKAAPKIVLEDYGAGTNVVLSLKDGDVASWSGGDSLVLEIFNGKDSKGEPRSITPTSVTASDITFTLPDSPQEDRLYEGSWSVDVKKAGVLIARSCLDVVKQIQFSGTVRNSGGNAIQTGEMLVIMSRFGDNRSFEFKTDSTGQYKAYWVEPGQYRTRVKPLQGQAYLGSADVTVTINQDGTCAEGSTRDFTLPDARLISGTVSLPSGTASTDIFMHLDAWSANNTPENKDDDRYGNTELKISAGQSSVAYNVAVPINAIDGNYMIKLYVDGDTGYVSTCLYSESGTKYSVSEASLIDVSTGNQTGKNIQLVTGKSITGTVTLPEGIAFPPEGMGIGVMAVMQNATPDNFEDDYVIRSEVFIPSGQMSAAYTIRVPDNPVGMPYIVQYDSDPEGPFETKGFYKTDGTTLILGEASGVDVTGGNQIGINLNVSISKAIASRAGTVHTIIDGVGKTKFVQPSVSEVTDYSALFTDWNNIPEPDREYVAIAVKNGIMKGTVDNKIIPGGALTRAEMTVLLCKVADALGAQLPLAFPGKTFNDIGSHWGKDFIETLARAGIVNGTPEGKFDPDNFFMVANVQPLVDIFCNTMNAATATRTGFIRTVLESVGAFKFTQPSANDISGYAVTYSDWDKIPPALCEYIAVAVKNGIVQGTPEGKILPFGFVSRAEAAEILCRVSDTLSIQLPLTDPGKTFNDIGSHWAKDYIERLARAGIVNGSPDGNYNPDAYVMFNQMHPFVDNFSNLTILAAPKVTFSFAGTDKNKLMGATTDMEFSIDGGTGWTGCTADMDLTSSLGSITAANDIKIRLKAVSGLPAGNMQIINILPAPAAPNLAVNFQNEKITSVTSLMEYGINSGAYQTVTTSETTSGIDLVSIIPANGGAPKTISVRIVSAGCTLTGAEQTLSIPAKPATPSAPTVASKTPTSITLTVVSGGEYTRDDGTTWQDSPVFTGLTTATAYTFKARIKATASAFASEKSAGTAVTIYTVTFEAIGGLPAPAVQTIIAGGNAASPAAMTRTGYTFGDWFTAEDLSGSVFDFGSAIDANTRLYAKWTINKYNVTTTVTGSGMISPAAKQVTYGENLTLTVLPNAGYDLTAFTVAGVNKLNEVINGKYLISNITAGVVVSATFSAKVYTVTKNAGTGGSITANATASHGSSLSVTIVPGEGKNINSVSYTMGTSTVVPSLAGDPKGFTINPVTGPVLVNATFADVDKSGLNAEIAAVQGVNPDMYTDIAAGAFKTAFLAAISVRDNLSATSAQVSEATTNLTNAANGLTNENKKVFTVTVSTPVNGSASVDKTSPKYGEDVTITAVPGGGYALYKILVNGVQMNDIIVKNVTQNITIDVLFKSTIPAAVTTFRTNRASILAKTVSNVVSGDSGDVDAAIADCNGLTADEKKHVVVEYQLLNLLRYHLDNMEKANTVITAITALAPADRNLTFVQNVGTVNAAYDALTPDQKKLVGIEKVNELAKYRAEANVIFQNDLAETAKVNHVNTLVNALPADASDLETAIKAYSPAKAAFDTLTAEQKAQVTNANKLTSLKSAIDTANQVAATAVQNLINALTKVTADMAFDQAEGCKADIIAAKKAYDALTTVQKGLVSTEAKSKLDECFESVAIVIERPVEGLDTSVSFTGISDKVADMDVTQSAASTESVINSAVNGSGAETAMKTEMMLNITLKDNTGASIQPEGKVKMRIKISELLSRLSPAIVYVDESNNVFEIPCGVRSEDGIYYLEFETDHFSNYAVMSAVKNTNANLQSFSLDGITLTPVFNKDVTGYTANVENNISSTTVNAVVEDTGKATLAGTGGKSLNVGTNTIDVTVTAEDGTTVKTYTATVVRAAAEENSSTNGNTGSGVTNDGGTSTSTTTETMKAPAVKTTVTTGNIATTSVTVKTTADNTTGTATAKVAKTTVNDLVKEAKTTEAGGKKAVVEIKVEADASAKAVEVQIPQDAFKQVADTTAADVKIDTGIGEIIFDAKAVDAIDLAAKASISISVTKVEVSALPEKVQLEIGNRPVYNFAVKSGDTEINKFGSGKATVSVPYTLSDGEDLQAVMVYYIDNSGKLETVKDGKYDPLTGKVTFKTVHFSTYAIGYNKKEFTDVAPNAWYNKAITFMAARRVVGGVGNGKFAPDNNVTRADFLIMMMNALGIELDADITDNFADAGKKYYTPYLGTAKRLGLVSGIGSNKYAPETTISRQDMLVILYNALDKLSELPAGNSGKIFEDFKDTDEVASYAKKVMKFFVESGTVTGDGVKLAPKVKTTRAQAAQILYKLLSE